MVEKYVIHTSKPLRNTVIVVVLCVLSLLAGWLAGRQEESILRFRHSQAKERLSLISESYKLLSQEKDNLLEENKTLNTRLVQLEQAGEIDKESIRQLKRDLSQLEDQMFQFREEINFYRSVIDSSRSATGLDIQGIHIRPVHSPGQYQYKTVLTNLSKKNNTAKGWMETVIEGVDVEEKKQSLALADILVDGSDEFSFSFKHFKVFSGLIRLPDGFKPKRSIIRLKTKKDGKVLVEKTFEWQQ